MKLGDIEISDLVHALGMERSAWINVAKQEGRRHVMANRARPCSFIHILGGLIMAWFRFAHLHHVEADSILYSDHISQ